MIHESQFTHGDTVEIDFNDQGKLRGVVMKVEFTPSQVFYDLEIESKGTTEQGEEFRQFTRLYHVNEGRCTLLKRWEERKQEWVHSDKPLNEI